MRSKQTDVACSLCMFVRSRERAHDQGHIGISIRLWLSVIGSSQLRRDKHALVAAWEVTRMAVLLYPRNSACERAAVDWLQPGMNVCLAVSHHCRSILEF